MTKSNRDVLIERERREFGETWDVLVPEAGRTVGWIIESVIDDILSAPTAQPAVLPHYSGRTRRPVWRCRHGWHRWVFVRMSDSRLIDTSWHSAPVCRLEERCERCSLHRTTHNAPVPTRPRTEGVQR